MTGHLTRLTEPLPHLPALFTPDPEAAKRFVEFFTASIRNANTRKAYARAAAQFAPWCEENDLRELRDIEPVHVAAYVETLQTRLAAPSVKQHLAAIRMLFDWLGVGQEGNWGQTTIILYRARERARGRLAALQRIRPGAGAFQFPRYSLGYTAC